nr:reverse transcriptase [Tanacetum cinerariifolium]
MGGNFRNRGGIIIDPDPQMEMCLMEGERDGYVLLEVTNVDGNNITSKSMCKGFNWMLHGEKFTIDVMLLLLEGCEMVLSLVQLFKHVGRKAVGLSSMNVCVLTSSFMTLDATHKTVLDSEEKEVLEELLAKFDDIPYKHPPGQKDAIESMLQCADHLSYLRSILIVIKENNLFSKQSKCVFGTSQVEYLGHIISDQGVASDPSKISAMVDWPTLSTIKKLRGFMRLTGYNRSHLQTLVKKAKKGNSDSSKYYWYAGQLRRKGKLLVGADNMIKRKLGMRKTVKQVVSQCDVCHRNKADLAAYLGLLQPLPIHEKIWQDISMNFIDRLPMSNGKFVIMVVVDKLSKYAHFIPVSHPYITTQYVIYKDRECNVEAVDRTLVAWDQIIKLLQFYLKRAQNKMKSMADKKRFDREFAEGDWVYLKLVMKKLGKMAYKLKLLSTAQVHDVFHVSQLKKCKSNEAVMGSFPHSKDDSTNGQCTRSVVASLVSKVSITTSKNANTQLSIF